LTSNTNTNLKLENISYLKMQLTTALVLQILSFTALAAAYPEPQHGEHNLYARDAEAYAYADPDAEPYYSDHQLYARDAEADAYAEAEAEAWYSSSNLYARNAAPDPYAKPEAEAWYSENELYPRDAEAEPYAYAEADPYAYAEADPFYSEHDIYARSANPNPYAEPEPETETHYKYLATRSLHEREALFGRRRKGIPGVCRPKGWGGKLMCIAEQGQGLVFPRTPCTKKLAY
jgi:hypothetical protein